LVIERDPIITAREVASLDLVSGGRVVFGVGVGWNRAEMENHGTDPRIRGKLMGERMQAMIETWTTEETVPADLRRRREEGLREDRPVR
jgi:alkanesulfonate monooxygenase SsuD/methylene tetrahydromethanopterin reductase-like flavin-dependent oxidoreductase (luciferase family)